ncbi:hypothetical protein KEM60_01547 [Austwickia sp. TVS 96-490-7B]|uniref:amino acid ABC transporter permease n=1 Tax=Austwickia sp. TVS 96-490-7B TaxID=2830843 RepID=UPI001C56213D|nr:amino acid ABC transporter permease [Austwickia sp. TVS 96-490-7B]MBW3085350.1 hypothetical protein [Austwickia sp. TVS 96-490-7B]
MSTQNLLFDAPGPRARRRHAAMTVIGAALTVGLLALIGKRFAAAGQLDPDLWRPFLTAEAWGAYLIPGLIGTFRATVLSVVFAGLFGVLFGMGRMSPIVPIRWFCGVVVEFFRAVPVLLMMVFAYFGFFARGVLDSQYAPLAAVVTALTLYNGSVIAELVRSGVDGLPRGQAEAGLSVGLTPWQTLRVVQLPQALTAMLPALVSQLIVVLKDSALGVAITFPELMSWSRTMGSAYANTVPAYLVAALLFILANYVLMWLAQQLEQRLKRRASGPMTAAAPTVLQGVGEPGEPATHGAVRAEHGVERAFTRRPRREK